MYVCMYTMTLKAVGALQWLTDFCHDAGSAKHLLLVVIIIYVPSEQQNLI